MSDPITPLTPSQTDLASEQAAHEGYVHRSLVGLDQFVNVLLDGSPDETISSRAARWATEETPGSLKHSIGTAVSKGLDMFQKDHGAKAEVGDLTRAQNVEAIEQKAEAKQ